MKKENYSKLNPKNREHAYAYQMEDCVKVLKACALNSKESFISQLKVIEGFINSYKSENN